MKMVLYFLKIQMNEYQKYNNITFLRNKHSLAHTKEQTYM
jgi:hypothetical protein